jgi:hypothetical protein
MRAASNGRTAAGIAAGFEDRRMKPNCVMEPEATITLRQAVLREVDSMKGTAIRYSW